jgi:hypothetical protein
LDEVFNYLAEPSERLFNGGLELQVGPFEFLDLVLIRLCNLYRKPMKPLVVSLMVFWFASSSS